jgi:hypothetical protein
MIGRPIIAISTKFLLIEIKQSIENWKICDAVSNKVYTFDKVLKVHEVINQTIITMKKIYLAICGIAASCVLSAQVAVTLNVDMNLQTVSGAGVHAAGNFYDNNYDGTADNAAYMSGSTADGNWDPAVAALAFTDEDLDGVHSLTLNLMPGRYEFKFINGDNWDAAETVDNACTVEVNGNGNRQIFVGTEPQSLGVCFSKCAACGENAVRFRVDMSTVDLDLDGNLAEPGEDISLDGVHVAGSFQGDIWDPSSVVLQDWNNDNVWETTISVGTLSTISYKYINGNSWDFPNESISGPCGPGDGNRSADISSDNTVLSAYCWNSCDACTQPVQITFQVDMNAACISTADGVNLMGTATNWASGVPMTDANLDGIWELTLGLAPGPYAYKFRVGTGGWEGFGGDRQLTVLADTPETLPAFCFGSADPCGSLVAPSDVTIQATPVANTIPSGQSLWVMGDFTTPTWQGGALQMTDDNADGTWSVFVPGVCIQSLHFKFVIGLDNTNTASDWLEESADFSTLPGACGIDNGTFSDNREFVRTSTEPVTICYTFNTCESCLVGVNENEVVSNLLAYPVPADDVLNVNFSSATAQTITLRLVNTLGQVAVEQYLGTVSGNKVINLNTNELSSGIYSLIISNGISQQTQIVSVK